MIKPLFTLCALLISVVNVWAQALHFRYDEANGTATTTNVVNGTVFNITNKFGRPERLAGVYNNALRTDGFSTWVTGNFNSNLGTQITIETWVALESYPADHEVPYANLTPSAIISQTDGNAGFEIGINAFGRYWFTANINGTKYTCQAPSLFPLYEWVHVAGVIDGNGGRMRLYLNGQQVTFTTIPTGGRLTAANVPLLVGKGHRNTNMGIFLLNAMNAAYDDTKIFASARSASNILNDYRNGIANARSTGLQATAVHANRFNHDIQRPRYHGMPPANWANEPHGLVRHNGKYHIFYQRTPNGPFKTLMNWGHMISTDLVHWTNTKDALRPSLEWSATSGYDMKGIWSGDVIIDNNVAHAFYTNVNHSGPYNPGIALATSSDPDFQNWTKQGPIIDKPGAVDDFRDPYLWKDGSTWKMIIGAKVSGRGGLDFYTSTNLTSWTRQSTFSTVSYSQMDTGSEIWEMPVFESIGNGKHILIVNPIGGSVAKYGPNFTRGVYWIGTWSNNRFTPDYVQPKMLDLIPGHLSPSVTRKADGKLVGMGIVDERRSSQAQLDAGWCHTFSLPRVYTLLPDNRTLGQAPDPGLQSLRVSGSRSTVTNQSVNGTRRLTAKGMAVEIIANVNSSTTASQYGLNLLVSNSNEEITRLYYDAVNRRIVLDKTNSSRSNQVEDKVLLTGNYDEAAFGKPHKFHVFIDHSIIDVFINDAAAFSARIYPTLSHSENIELFSQGASTNFTSVDVWTLRPHATTVAVSSVSLNKSSAVVPLTTTLQLEATVNPYNATNKNVTWSSSNTAVARVSPTGVVTPVAVGTATITVRTESGGRTATCNVTVSQAPNYLVYDFESGNLNGWQNITGTAFTAGDVTSDVNWGWGGPFNQQGSFHYWGAKNGGDSRTGSMRTRDFVIGGHGIITFMIGGGYDINNLYIALVRKSDNQILMRATGDNNDSEAYVHKQFDASAFIGTECYIRVVDNHTGGWGHINIDNIRIPVQDYLIYDFESGNLSGWQNITGTAFTAGDVTSDVNWGWGGPFNHQGNFHLWGHKNGGDSRTGSMRTRDFVLGGNGVITFLVGGGYDVNNLYIALVQKSNNQILMRASGDNNDSEAYVQKQFNAAQYIGTECYISVVDNHTGGWGHINLDNIRIPIINMGARLAEDDGTEEIAKAKAEQVNEVENEESFTSELIVYPNPSDKHFYIQADEELTLAGIQVVDVTGRAIKAIELRKISNNLWQLNHNLPSGLYYLRVMKGNDFQYKKIIVKD